MIDMARDTFKLAVENKLFANPAIAYTRVGIGAAGTAVVLVACGYAPIPLWLSATIAGFAGGFSMPYLFRDIKFK